MFRVITHNEVSEESATTPEEQMRIYKNLVRSLTRDALGALGELEMWCQDANQLEQCNLVRHYLEYLQRTADGTA